MRMAVPLLMQIIKASDGKYIIGEASIHPAHGAVALTKARLLNFRNQVSTLR